VNVARSSPTRNTPLRKETAGARTLIQVVPRWTKEPNGVVDYAVSLARALRARGIESVFVSGTPVAGMMTSSEGWKVVSVSGRRAADLAVTLERLTGSIQAAAVLLHFSGYGYQKRGIPIWLLRGFERFRRGSGEVPLLIIFHELYASGRLWQSSFWLSPIQKLIARRFLKLSTGVIATTELCADRLRDWNGDSQISSMPVFSNVGEPGCGLPASARPATAVVFGLAGVEERLFGSYRHQVERLVGVMGVERIIDIGPRFLSQPSHLAGVPVIAKGALPAAVVSELLQKARFGLVAYPFDALGKSGVFASYAAHGTVPIVFPERRGFFDGLEVGRHFLDGSEINNSLDADRLDRVQRAVFGWYAAHSLHAQARLLERAIDSGGAIHLHALGDNQGAV
jgi:hypothetical protein